MGATTLGIITFTIMTLSIKGLYVTHSINDTLLLWHYVIVPNVTFPNVTIPKLVKIPNINRNPTIPPLYMPDP